MMHRVQKAAVMLAVYAPWVVLCLDSCEPDCFGKDPGDKVADPKNCTQYYLCLDDGSSYTDHALSCGSQSHFDSSEGDCRPGEGCVAECVPPDCPICSGPVSLTADLTDCHRYYVCLVGEVTGPYDCPADKPFFDGANCIVSENHCCTGFCFPYCQPGNVQIPDPYDCHSYYICINEGPASLDQHHTCDPGEFFDYKFGRCIPGVVCTPVCPSPTLQPILPTSDCQTSLMCTALGYFPKCHSCNPGFFECTAVNQLATSNECVGDLVFNTDPAYPYCVLPSACLNHPPS